MDLIRLALRPMNRLMAELCEDAVKLLQELEEEQATSLRRRRLHERIAFYPERATEDLDQEREISARRRDLDARIDALPGEMGMGRPE
jgi:hypothetical protein